MLSGGSDTARLSPLVAPAARGSLGEKTVAPRCSSSASLSPLFVLASDCPSTWPLAASRRPVQAKGTEDTVFLLRSLLCCILLKNLLGKGNAGRFPAKPSSPPPTVLRKTRQALTDPCIHCLQISNSPGQLSKFSQCPDLLKKTPRYEVPGLPKVTPPRTEFLAMPQPPG
ncbi:hypothetical protein JEQ12_016082 [Ovis aries]|uniref:Uncharacterized protein n=1 Tax=Ovis aries TaxID=9940 RepID=A0A836ABH6_SHEEP|nr:hypothetical protein JEQ12_016082 [Ovis aries]